ncbi:MAG: Hpt domain-containing protein [Proteobacteria bacterium]|nr:Hpt domain-containing protein [Pseudomonadota bacterium]
MTPSLHEATTNDALDPRSLDQLRALDPTRSTGFLQRVLQTYLQALERQTGQMTEAAQRQDAGGVGAAAHSLKSASASIGAKSMAAECAALERLAQAGWSPALALALPDIGRAAAQARTAVQRELASV